MSMVISATSEKGGSGKSTLVTNMAAYWANKGESVVVLDLDPQASSKTWGRLREEAGDGLETITVLGLEELERSGADRSDLDVGSIVERARARWDRVLLDVPGADNRLQRGALLACDVALMPIKASGFDALAAPNTFAVLEALGKARSQSAQPVRAMMVFNFARPRSVAVRETARVYKQDMPGIEVLSVRLHHREDFADAALVGMGVVEYDPGSKAAVEVRHLAREIDDAYAQE
ncbi:MAG: ParA family protein [Myxococcota bacterium]